MTEEELYELFHEYFDYNEESGVMLWKKKKGRAKKGDIVGSSKTNGYLNVMIKRKSYLVHRIAWLMTYESFPEEQIDHINHNRFDNRMANLREVGYKENSQNRTRRNNNTSGISGVRWDNRHLRWTANIGVDYKRIHLGSFVEFSDAVNARKNAEVLYGFHTNHGKD